jgi:hypothetical protein
MGHDFSWPCTNVFEVLGGCLGVGIAFGIAFEVGLSH